tara:strand:+ start:607 stop:861 length:255 start_codon:yes stop_codon:yes gene_type:complete
MDNISEHKKSIQALVDVTEAMLHAMEKNNIVPEDVTKKPEFAVLVHLLKSILDGELNIYNELTETLKEKTADLDLEFHMNKKLH